MKDRKNKSAAKLTMVKSLELENKVLRTMDKIARIVGATLGPGGSAVLIETDNDLLPPILTKDGVTVHRHLGFQDSTEQAILEVARSAAVQTAAAVGDGPQPKWAK